MQAVEYPYYLVPPFVWERQLVWFKNVGIRAVEFSVPAKEFTGRENPRLDLAAFIRVVRRVGLEAWVDTGAEGRAEWRQALGGLLAPQTANHGGPLMWAGPPLPGVDAAAAPSPVMRIAATDADALARSREALANPHGALLWTNVVDELYPAGWAGAGTPPLKLGALGLNGEERATAALRRDALLLEAWAPLLGAMRAGPPPRPAAGKFPPGVTAALLVSNAASAISILNRSAQPFEGALRATDPESKRAMTIPAVRVAAGESLWLPLAVSLSQKALCRECSNFSPVEQVLYATAELLSIEYENGILAMEFAAPEAASVVLQLDGAPPARSSPQASRRSSSGTKKRCARVCPFRPRALPTTTCGSESRSKSRSPPLFSTTPDV